MMPPALDILTLALEWRSQRAETVLMGLCGVLRAHGLPESGYRYRGRAVTLSAIAPEVRKSQVPAFSLEGDEGRSLQFISFPDGYDQITVRWPHGCGVQWEEWLTPFAGASLTLGWVADTDYHYWQNLEDPDAYQREGRSLDGVSLIPDILPNRQLIDTSSNPGHVIRRPGGYPQAVGSVMWIGERFWALCGVDRRAVESTEWLQTRDLRGGVLRIQAAEQLFTSAEGDSGDLQRRLRRLLFPARAIR